MYSCSDGLCKAPDMDACSAVDAFLHLRTATSPGQLRGKGALLRTPLRICALKTLATLSAWFLRSPCAPRISNRALSKGAGRAARHPEAAARMGRQVGFPSEEGHAQVMRPGPHVVRLRKVLPETEASELADALWEPWHVDRFRMSSEMADVTLCFATAFAGKAEVSGHSGSALQMWETKGHQKHCSRVIAQHAGFEDLLQLKEAIGPQIVLDLLSASISAFAYGQELDALRAKHVVILCISASKARGRLLGVALASVSVRYLMILVQQQLATEVLESASDS